MKAHYLIIPVLLSLCCCTREAPEQESPAGTVTICASVSESEGTKVSLTPDGNGLHLAWESGDCLRVISGSQSEKFEIKDDFTDHTAKFTGKAVSGSSFDILYPGDFASAEEVEGAENGAQTQSGNANTDHLRYAALLSGVDDYTDITFSPEWAASHGGTFKTAGAIRLTATLPKGVSQLKDVSIDLGGSKLSLGLKNIDVSKSAQVLDAYLMTPWEDIVLAAGAKVGVKIHSSEGGLYATEITISEGATLRSGRVSNFVISKGIEEQLFESGSGTAADPWVIVSTRQMENMMELYKKSTQTDFTWYFKLAEDVDISSIDWVSLNRTSPYKRGIDFDGQGHTISGLTSGPDNNYPSFAGVLCGNIKDVTFTGATINAGNNKCGVVCGYLGTTGVVGNCSGVTVKNSTVNGTNHMGGFAGQVACAAAIEDCHVEDVTITQGYTSTGRSTGGFAGHISANPTFNGCSFSGSVTGLAQTGGFAGYAEQATFNGCFVQDATVTDTHNGKSTRSAGFVGYVAMGVNISGCYVKNTIVNAPKGQRIAGFIGQLGSQSTGKNADLISASYTQDCTVTGGALSGGFVGVQYNDIEKCYVSGGTVTLGGTNGGGFSGFAQNGNLMNCYTTAAVNAGANSPIGGMIGIAYAATVYSCYTSGAISCTGANVGAFIGQSAVEGNSRPALVANSISWNAGLPAIASNTVEATVSNCYIGNSGTVSSQASALGWNTDIWNLSAALPTLKPGTASGVNVAFIGDSITWQWVRTGFHPEYFAAHEGYVNKGISGEQTYQMLARYPYDMVALHPKVVVIMGGTNDIANAVTQDDIMANLKAMAEMSAADGAKVVLCSVTPCNRKYSAVGGPKTLAILPLNEAIKAYVQEKGFTYCDYYPVLADENDGLKIEYQNDDLHPNREGYIAMEAVIQPILDHLLNN